MPPSTAAPDPTPVLHVQQLCFGWPQRPLFDRLSFHLPPGLSLLQGDEGSGKSSLLRLLAGELQAQSGRLWLHGQAMQPQHPTHRQQVFWLDPRSTAHDACRVSDFLAQQAHEQPHFDEALRLDLEDAFDLAPYQDKPLYMLSTGCKRKVWLTAALAAGTPLTLLDQPFAALDAPSVRVLRSILQDLTTDPQRAWLLADHEAPAQLPLAQTIRLPD